MACMYQGQQYSEGALTCQSGAQMRCYNDGVWRPTGANCREVAKGSYEALDAAGKATATMKQGDKE
jgi:hypothetical protein